MSSIPYLDRNSAHFLRRINLRSSLQAQRVSIKRIFPKTIKFDLEESLNPLLFKRIFQFVAKCKPTLKNPPVKYILKHSRLMKQTKAISIKPEDAQAYIKKISLYFTRLNQISICTQENSFAPMKVKGKIRPIRSLKTFCHNHELCQEFMTCARYVTFLKIKRSSVNLLELKRFKRLETLYLLFNTKYVTFEEQDQKFIHDLVGVITNHLPILNRIILSHEIDPENHPYIPLQLQNALEGRVQVDLITDLVDISNYRNQNSSIDRIFSEIRFSGIQRVKINYAGVMKPVKKFARWFHVPAYFKKELYLKLLKAIQISHFNWTQFEPIIHSAYFNAEIKDTLIALMMPNSRVKIPKVTLIYCLDTIEEDMLKLLLDLYKGSILSYDLVMVSTTYLTHEQSEKLEHHYAQVLSRVQRYDVKFSLSITARTYKNFISILQIIVPRVNISRLQSLSIKIINPITKAGLQNFAKLLIKSLAFSPVQNLEISLAQEGVPSSQDIFEMIGYILQKSIKLKRLSFLHLNSDEHEEVISEAFQMLRRKIFWIDLKYDINRERGVLYEQI